MRQFSRQNQPAKIASVPFTRLKSTTPERTRAPDHGPSRTPALPIGFDFSRISVHAKTPVGIQPKLTIGAPGDAFEQEADRVAEQVMRMPEPPARSQVPTGLIKHPVAPSNQVQTNTGNRGGTAAPPIVHDVLRSTGQPLDAATRAFMEPRFGHDFSKVRVHADARAAESARSMNALAYTVGRDLVFGSGQYETRGARGRALLAHELVHTVQQGQAVSSTGGRVEPGNNRLETKASPAASQTGSEHSGIRQRTDLAIQLQHASPKGTNKNQSEAMQKQSDEIAERLQGVGKRFLDEWFSAMSGGANSIPEPADPEAGLYWDIALAGNLAWAATGLLAPELVVPVSFAGAAIGSGAVQKSFAISPPAGKPHVISSLAQARDLMEPNLKSKVTEAVADILQKKITNKDLQDQILWNELFFVPYDKKFQVMVATAQKRTEAALSDFMSQYKAWRKEIDELVRNERTPSYWMGGPESAMGLAVYLLAPPHTGESTEIEKKHPFKPKLKF
jgi:hypothetical protein